MHSRSVPDIFSRLPPPAAMSSGPIKHRTGIATVFVSAPRLVEIHYDDHIVFQVKAVAEVQAKRRELMGDSSYATLTIIPANVDFHLDAMGADQAAADRREDRIIASAIVAETEMVQRLTKLYFAYYTPLQRILITEDEAKARVWLHQQLEDFGRTGS